MIPVEEVGTLSVDICGKKYMYLNLPKNASSSIKLALDGSWCYHTIMSDSDPILNEVTNFIVVLRDPLDRWISATVQHFEANRGEIIDPNNTLFMDFIFTKIQFEMHSVRQVDYLSLIKNFAERCVYFELNNNFTSNINSYLGSIGVNEVVTHIDNVSAPTKDTVLVKFIKAHPNYKQKIVDYYKADYDLINSVVFI